MDLKINPTKKSLNGEIIAPGSKSYSHRAFIVASLTDGVSVIKNPLTTGDVEVTIDLLKKLKVNIRKESESSYIIERNESSYKPIYSTISCKNSGTTLRIFSALSLIIEGGLSFSGEFLKRNRPIQPLLDALKFVGGEYKMSRNTLEISRKQKICKPIKIPGDISSQFITALLIVGPMLPCNNTNTIEIEITSPLVSYPYIKITLNVLRSFGINIFEKLDEEKKGKYLIPSNQRYRPQVFIIPGDFSSAAFIIAASILAPEESSVIINNLDIQDPQGDKRLLEILSEMGANIRIVQEKNQVIINGGLNRFPLKGLDVDCGDIPDLFPILSVIGAFAEGKTTLFNASNIRLKESDRISVMARELKKMGVELEEKEDRMTIFKCANLQGTKFNHENDHRIAMACCIASLYADSSSQIENIEITEDSYPTFLSDLQKLGADIKLIE